MSHLPCSVVTELNLSQGDGDSIVERQMRSEEVVLCDEEGGESAGAVQNGEAADRADAEMPASPAHSKDYRLKNGRL